ncbi:hypothetical protein BH10BAC3_BH10BAC3_12240 [soil metagenome]
MDAHPQPENYSGEFFSPFYCLLQETETTNLHYALVISRLTNILPPG